MEKAYVIRNERPDDWRAVENLTREAFYNIYAPGCDEHYLVHVMRAHKDFIPALDFVAEADGQLIGSIMYTKASLINEQGGEKQILTFGPLSVLPAYQRKGVGRLLVEHSAKKAKELGYDVIVIMGDPANYIPYGFKSCQKYNISLDTGVYPSAMLAKELTEGCTNGRKWVYQESEAYHIDKKLAEAFDLTFEPKLKEYRPSQELFYINSHSILRNE